MRKAAEPLTAQDLCRVCRRWATTQDSVALCRVSSVPSLPIAFWLRCLARANAGGGIAICQIRVMSSVTRFLEEELRLRMNWERSPMATVRERRFLGYRILWDGRRAIAPRSLERAKRRIREIARRNRSIRPEQMTGEPNITTAACGDAGTRDADPSLLLFGVARPG